MKTPHPIAASLAFLMLLSGPSQVWAVLPPPPLPGDDKTEGLFEFTKEGITTKQLPSLSGKAAAGKLFGQWEFIDPQELRPNFPGAGQVRPNGHGEAVFSGLQISPGNTFSIDVLLRWDKNGGIFLRVGSSSDPLAMGVLQRGPGLFELRVPIRTPGGQTKTETLSSSEIYQAPHIEPAKLDEFDLYSLTYDGAKTFTLFINGHKAFAGTLQEGEAAWDGTEVAVGEVGKWNSAFKGAIAAVRISQGVRSYAPKEDGATAFSPASTNGWTFDAGPKDSPLSTGAIPLDSTEFYTKGRGFGWLQPPKGDFDAWYSPARFEDEPKEALAKKTYKIHDFLTRDGVIAGGGDFFRADLPGGTYWVAVGLGNSLGKGEISEVSANGTVLGVDLRMNGNVFHANTPHRTVRGLVRVEGGKGLTLRGSVKSGEGIPIQSISILPYAPLPVVWKDGRLQWQGQGAAPTALAQVSDALSRNDLAGAVHAVDTISDPFIRACALACILGEPKLPDDADLAVAQEIRQLLLGVLRDQPGNTTAHWLFDSTERFRHGLVAYLGSFNGRGGDEVVYGTRFNLWLATANQELQLKPEDPEYWQAKFLAGAGIWQYGMQGSAFNLNGSTDAYVAGREIDAFAPPAGLFREVKAAFPDFRIARIMLGERLPTADGWKAPANAPEWAVLQYQLTQRILEVIHFWVDERMDERGLFGGGIGDDVEMLRWWWPAILLADDETAVKGWRLLADTAWKSTGGAGYSQGMDDVEHSSENTSDPFPPLALINYQTDQMTQTESWLTRTLPTFRDIWTTVTPDGHRMFKGHFLNATEIKREGDVTLNVRVIKPLLWAAWALHGKNPELDRLLTAYAISWRDAIMKDFDDKPAGIVPMMIMLNRTAAKQSDGKDWASPGYIHAVYPNYAGKVYDLLFAAYEITRDQTFLDPIRLALANLIKIAPDDLDPAKYPASSGDWALRSGVDFIGVAGATYRSLTGDQSYDSLLERVAPPLTRFQIAPGAATLEPVLQDLKHALAKMNSNLEERTTMVQSTDRIFVPGSIAVSSMATGVVNWNDPRGRGGELVWPTFQITWKGTRGQLAALVEKATPTELGVLLYNFSDQPLSLRPRVWKLAKGSYQMSLVATDKDGTSSKNTLIDQEIKIESSGQEISFDLPAQTPAKLIFVKK